MAESGAQHPIHAKSQYPKNTLLISLALKIVKPSKLRFKMENKINWEERRFIAACQILSGICASYQDGKCPSPYRVEDAVRLADCLISILADPKFMPPREKVSK